MRDHLQIDTTGIHLLQTSSAKITQLRLQFCSECPTRAPCLARGGSLHNLSEPIGQEMFFDRNGSHGHSSSRKRCSIESSESSRVDTHTVYRIESGDDMELVYFYLATPIYH